MQLFLDQCLERLQLGSGVGGVFLRVDLDVITLNEQRPGEPLAQRGGRHHGDVLGGPLVGVGDLAAGDLADDRPGVELLGRAEDGAPRVVRENPHVHRRRRERRHFAAPPRQVQLVDRCGPHAGLLPHLPNHPARVRLLVLGPEHSPTHQGVNVGAFLEHERTASSRRNLCPVYVDNQPVVRRRDPARQLRGERRMREFVREMREERAPRAHTLCRLHRFRNRQVQGMGTG